MDTTVAEFMSFLQAGNGDSLIRYVMLLVFVLIGSASVICALVYRRILNERRRIASKVAQENFEAIAADLRRRALGMKERDDELRKHELKIKECDEPKALGKNTNAELDESECERSQQQQALKEQQRILMQSVSHSITLGLKDNQNRLLEIDLKGMLSSVQLSSVQLSSVQRKRNEAA
jgi:hypothetical protein